MGLGAGDHLIIQQQLTQEQHNSQPVPPQLSGSNLGIIKLVNSFSEIGFNSIWSVHEIKLAFNGTTCLFSSSPVLHSEHTSSNDHHDGNLNSLNVIIHPKLLISRHPFRLDQTSCYFPTRAFSLLAVRTFHSKSPPVSSHPIHSSHQSRFFHTKPNNYPR